MVMNNNNAKVSALRHLDYKGKEQLYVKIEVNEKVMFINVGKGTIEDLEGLLKEEIKADKPKGGENGKS